ncbi:MAG: hypothetical protein Kow0010_06140 [Dehalococcoidia bacterium]
MLRPAATNDHKTDVEKDRGGGMKFGTLRLTSPDGRVKEYPLELASIVIGRAPGSGIEIDDRSIARRHARLTVDSGRLLIEDLGSANGTFVDGHRIPPNTPSLVTGSQSLRLGEVEAVYTPPPPVGTSTPTGDAEEPEAPPAVVATFVPPDESVDPGSPATASVRILNRGRIVDEFTLGVVGIPEEWVHFGSRTVRLLPGQETEVTLVIQPPRTPAAVAGDYEVAISITSVDTGKEVLASGPVRIRRFRDTSLEIRPLRAKKNFRVHAANHGNALVTYALEGTDEEEAYTYDFESPTIALHPGESREVRLKAKRKKRKWFGPPQVAFFELHARATDDPAEEPVVARGQIQIRPPLERFKRMFTWFMLIALLAAAVAAAYFLLRDDDSEAAANGSGGGGPPDPEVTHLCEPEHAEQRAAAASGAANAPGPDIPRSPGFNGFAQTDPRWAQNQYARAGDPNPDWCGTTIAQCGCALSSLATLMVLFDLVSLPEGEELNPGTLNTYFNRDARRTAHGWVSYGYVYGDVLWTTVNGLSPEIVARTGKGTPLRFSRFGTGAEDEIRAELEAGRPVILAVPGHYIAAVGFGPNNEILINDPYYRDRTILSEYPAPVLNSVLFEPATDGDHSAVIITVPKKLRIKVTDQDGRVVGTHQGDTPEDAKENALVGIDGAQYHLSHGWRDPTCINRPPGPEDGTVQIVLPGGKAADYRIEVIDPAGGPTTVSIHEYDEDGTVTFDHVENTGPTILELTTGPDTGGNGDGNGDGEPTPTPDNVVPIPTVDGGNGNGAEPTPTPEPGNGSPTETPADGTPTPTGTPTPAPPGAAMTCATAISGDTATVTCNAAVAGDFTTIAWQVNGVPYGPGANKTSIALNFTSDTQITVVLSACNGTSCGTATQIVNVDFDDPAGGSTVIVTPPSGNGGGNGAPGSVSVACNTSYSPELVATLNCSAVFSGTSTSVGWSAPGANPASQSGASSNFVTQVTQTKSVKVTAEVCNGSACGMGSTTVSVLIDPQVQGCNTTEYPTVTCTAAVLGGSGSGSGGGGGSVAAARQSVPVPTSITWYGVVGSYTTPIGACAEGSSTICEFNAEQILLAALNAGVQPNNGTLTLAIQVEVCYGATCRTSTPLIIGVFEAPAFLAPAPQCYGYDDGGIWVRCETAQTGDTATLHVSIPAVERQYAVTDDLPFPLVDITDQMLEAAYEHGSIPISGDGESPATVQVTVRLETCTGTCIMSESTTFTIQYWDLGEYWNWE